MADQKLSDARASAVYLEGPTHEPFAIAYGKYARSPDMNDDRHVYKSGDGVHALWYAGDAWYFGLLESVGKRVGFLSAKENTDVPEDIVAPWMMAAEGVTKLSLSASEGIATTSLGATDAVLKAGGGERGQLPELVLGKDAKEAVEAILKTCSDLFATAPSSARGRAETTPREVLTPRRATT